MRAGVAAVIAGVVMLAAPAGASPQGVDTTCQFALTRLSSAEDRPASARAECGVTWLAWGPQTQGLLIYRHMLPDPSFAQAIQNVPQPGAEAVTMGDYYPNAEYLAGPGEFTASGCRRG
jgi:hypothetical protein